VVSNVVSKSDVMKRVHAWASGKDPGGVKWTRGGKGHVPNFAQERMLLAVLLVPEVTDGRRRTFSSLLDDGEHCTVNCATTAEDLQQAQVQNNRPGGESATSTRKVSANCQQVVSKPTPGGMVLKEIVRPQHDMPTSHTFVS
jgi:hypothetical protein